MEQQSTPPAPPPRPRRRRRRDPTDLVQSLFGAADWINSMTTLGAMLTVCVFTFAAGLFTFVSPVQGEVVSSPLTTTQHDSSFLYAALDLFLSFVRCILASMCCTTYSELTLLLATMLIALVDVEKVLGSIKLRETIIILGLQRIVVQCVLNVFFLSRPLFAMTPSAAWFGVTATVMRLFLVPPRRHFCVLGLLMSEQTVCALVAFQLSISCADGWCWLTSILAAVIGCSRHLAPIHVRSRFFPALWPDDVEMEDATVYARFFPIAQQE